MNHSTALHFRQPPNQTPQTTTRTIPFGDAVPGGGSRLISKRSANQNHTSHYMLKLPNTLRFIIVLSMCSFATACHNNTTSTEKDPTVANSPKTPLETWAAMKDRVKVGDFNGASAFFVAKNREAYRKMFKEMGKARAYEMVSRLTEYKAWMMNDELAGYTARGKDDDKDSAGFPLNFEKENGEWKILEF